MPGYAACCRGDRPSSNEVVILCLHFPMRNRIIVSRLACGWVPPSHTAVNPCELIKESLVTCTTSDYAG